MNQNLLEKLRDIQLFAQHVNHCQSNHYQLKEMTKQEWQTYAKKIKKDITAKQRMIKNIEKLKLC